MSIKNGSLADALEDRFSAVKEEEALLEDHLPKEVIIGNNRCCGSGFWSSSDLLKSIRMV